VKLALGVRSLVYWLLTKRIRPCQNWPAGSPELA
jgi:hypothetical protein